MSRLEDILKEMEDITGLHLDLILMRLRKTPGTEADVRHLEIVQRAYREIAWALAEQLGPVEVG